MNDIHSRWSSRISLAVVLLVNDALADIVYAFRKERSSASGARRARSSREIVFAAADTGVAPALAGAVVIVAVPIARVVVVVVVAVFAGVITGVVFPA